MTSVLQKAQAVTSQAIDYAKANPGKAAFIGAAAVGVGVVGGALATGLLVEMAFDGAIGYATAYLASATAAGLSAGASGALAHKLVTDSPEPEAACAPAKKGWAP